MDKRLNLPDGKHIELVIVHELVTNYTGYSVNNKNYMI